MILAKVCCKSARRRELYTRLLYRKIDISNEKPLKYYFKKTNFKFFKNFNRSSYKSLESPKLHSLDTVRG